MGPSGGKVVLQVSLDLLSSEGHVLVPKWPRRVIQRSATHPVLLRLCSRPCFRLWWTKVKKGLNCAVQASDSLGTGVSAGKMRPFDVVELVGEGCGRPCS